MAVTVPNLAIALRLHATGETLDADVSAILTRILAAAVAEVDAYASDAPQTVKDEAAIRFSGWLYDRAPVGGRMAENGFALSGARALLSTWHNPTWAAI